MQRGVADDQPPTQPGGREHATGREPKPDALAPGPAHHGPAEQGGADPLGDRGAGGRADDPPAGAVDERDVEGDVEQVDGDDHAQGRAGVLQPAQHAGRGEDHQQGGQPERDHAQVGGAQRGHLGGGAVQAQDRRGERDQHRGDDQPEQGAQDHAVDAAGQGAGAVPRAEAARHHRGGAIGEEDRQPDHDADHVRGQRQAPEVGRAEVADDEGVGQHQHRLGDQRRERRDRQREDLAVEGAPGHAGDQPQPPSISCTLTDSSWAGSVSVISAVR